MSSSSLTNPSLSPGVALQKITAFYHISPSSSEFFLLIIQVLLQISLQSQYLVHFAFEIFYENLLFVLCSVVKLKRTKTVAFVQL